MEHIIYAMPEQSGRGFKLQTKSGMRPLRPMPDANHESLAKEDGGLAVGDPILRQISCSRNDEQLVVVDVHLGQLMGLERVLDRQWMQAVVILKQTQLQLRRLEQADPDEFRAVGRAPDRLIERDRAGDFPLAIEICRDNAHGCAMCWDDDNSATP